MTIFEDSAHSDAPWVIESKFDPSRSGLKLVRRERLMRLLDEGVSRRLVLVTAPAGYGKSSLLGQWVEEQKTKPLALAWVTLESDEADGNRFLAYITMSLARAGVDLQELETGARDGFAESTVSAILPKLIRSINASDQKMVLILEDYHAAESEAVNAITQQLVRDVLSDFTLFIDSRRQPEINAFSLIASGDAMEVDASQLTLTREETLAALRGVADDASGMSIYEETEGWPVAVQLARIQKRTQPNAQIVSGAKSGLIASYLTEQILSSLDEETQEFLLALSFLDRFNAELTAYVMDKPDVWQLATSLTSFNALILRLDSEGDWYRLHHLFAEYLKELQTRRDSARARAILIRASEWYAARGEIARAVKYAAAANEYEVCKGIIRTAGGWRIILTNGIGELRGALRHLPAATIVSSPSVLIARAYLHCKDGEVQDARAQLMAAIGEMDADRDEALQIDLVVVESMINLYEDRAVWLADHKEMRLRLREQGRLQPLELGTITCEEAITNLAEGRLEEADHSLLQAFDAMRQSGSVLGLNYCYIHAAHLALLKGEFDYSAANIERALDMADENFGSDSGLKTLALVLHHTLAAWRGTASSESLPQFETALQNIVENDGWVEIYMLGLEGFLLHAVQFGEHQAGKRMLRLFDTFAKQKILPRLEQYVSVSARLFEMQIATGSRYQLSIHSSAEDVCRLEAAPRMWQVRVLQAIINHDPETIEPLMSFASGAGAQLAHLRLSIAEAWLNMQAGVEAGESFMSVLRDASTMGVVGPFLADPAILKVLSQIRPGLLNDQGALMMVRFIDDVLTKARKLGTASLDSGFSSRESEVIVQLADGKSNKEIARALELTENTVKFHLKSIYAKLGVNKRTQAVLEAQKLGLID